MKRWGLGLLLIVLTVCSVSAQTGLESAVRSFDDGTARLLEGDFPGALTSFEQAETAGWSSPALFYNMALAHHRMNRLGQAVQYLEKAAWLAPDDAKIKHALNVANRKQADRFSQLPVPFWKKAHLFMVRTLPIQTALWIGILFWIGFAVLFAGKLLLNWRGEWWRRFRMVIGVLAIPLLLYALTSSAWPPYQQRAVILPSEVELKSEADPSASEILVIHEGLVVTVKDQSSDWTLIKISNGTEGWVASNSLGLI